MLSAIIISILIIAIMFVIVLIMGLVINWYVSLDMADHYITFGLFQDSYNADASNWRLQNDYVKFYNSHYSPLEFKFNFIDYYRYKLWHHGIKKQVKKMESCMAQREVLKTIKQDVQDLEAEYNTRLKVLDSVITYLKKNGVYAKKK